MDPIQHIAFVDDDPDDHHIFSATLSELRDDVQLSSFYDCNQLISFLDSSDNLPDLIFLDLNMPTYDGRECLQLLKKHHRVSHVPVIIYSTSRQEKDVALCYGHGAFKYLVKPRTFEKLKEMLRPILLASGNSSLNMEN